MKDILIKKIYGWFENVWGYVTACKKYCDNHNLNWEDYWKENRNNKIYLVHAKDNIPFHTVIFPSLLIATDDNYKLPDKIISDEFITINGEKLSKSKGNYITVRELLDKYDVDVIRYYFLIHDPEKRDLNFTYLEFIKAINNELLGKWGNFINRTLQFINKSFDGKLNRSNIDIEIEKKLKELFDKVSYDIDEGNIKSGIKNIFEYIDKANKYFDNEKPWIYLKKDRNKCNEILYNCVNIISNINILLKPYLPNSCIRVEKYLNISNNKYQYQRIKNVNIIKNIEPLYKKYEYLIIN